MTSLTPWQKIVRGEAPFTVEPIIESEAAHFYWCTEIKTTEINEAYCDGVSNNMLANVIGPALVVGMICTKCLADVYATSRTQAGEFYKYTEEYTGRRSRDFICKSCTLARREADYAEYEAERAARRAREFELRTMPYREYLLTPEWNGRRERALRVAHYCCQTCSSGGIMHVHHRTYVRRGEERVTDLIVLCADCHKLFHDNRRLADSGRASA